MTKKPIAAPDFTIQVRGLGKTFETADSRRRVTAIEHLDLRFEPGEAVCVVGPTGCGKSTFFNILAGLETPTRGEVRIAGREPYADFDWFKGVIGVIFQEDRLLPWRTALENIELGLEVLGAAHGKRRAEARHWLVQMGLEGFEDAFPSELSGGMRQRVSMARALAVRPRILLLDEAFSRLDEITAARLRKMFADLAHTDDVTVILITHQLEEAIEFGERILVFGKPGKLLDEVRPTLEGRAALRERIGDLLRQSES